MSRVFGRCCLDWAAGSVRCAGMTRVVVFWRFSLAVLVSLDDRQDGYLSNHSAAKRI